MQTNKPLNVDDLPIIIRFYQSQNIKKAYRVTYRSKSGNEDFVGAKDKNEADKKVKEIEDGGHKIINVELLKAKVYVKNPAEAPKNVGIYRGPAGGLYYETEEIERTQKTPKNTNNLSESKSITEINNRVKDMFNVVLPTNLIGAGFILSDGDIISLPAHSNIGHLYNEVGTIFSINRFMKDANTIRVHNKDGILSIQIDINSDISENQWNILEKIPMVSIVYDISDKGRELDSEYSDSIIKVKEIFNKIKYNTKKNIQKAKVYVKNPQDAPQGVKVQEGKRGGHYYETNNKNRQQEKPQQQRIENIRVLTTDSPDFDKIERYISVGAIHPINIEKPLNKDHIQKVINDNKIDISDVQVNILPFDVMNIFAFTAPNNNNKIYLASTPDKIIYDWLDELYSELTTVGYKLDEINDARNVDTKRAASIIHEIGHTKVYKAVGITESMKSMSELRQKQFKIFNNYVQYLKEFYHKSEQIIYTELEEMLAEDYRQLVGGIQSKMPSRYFYVDDLNKPQLKEGRLNILRKMGVF